MCLDDPGVRADVVAYVAAAASRAAGHAAWHAIDVGSELPDGFCLCPHTARRFREWLRATFGSDARPAALAASDRASFVALARRDHLALLSDAASARASRFSSSSAGAPSIVRNLLGEPPGQDDWLMTTVVDQYGTLVPPHPGRAPSLTRRGVGARARRHALGRARKRMVDDRRRGRRAGRGSSSDDVGGVLARRARCDLRRLARVRSGRHERGPRRTR